MATPAMLLDTDILSALMRQDPLVMDKAEAYLAEHGAFMFSIITQYEILRGLKGKAAPGRAETFQRLCQVRLILPLTEKAIIEASSIYADLHRSGDLLSDADILIAGSTIAEGVGVVTNNESHFQRIPNLRIDNWLK